MTDRTLTARIAAHTRWAHEPDRSAATAPARQAFADRFERDVDPDGKLDPVERATRAEHARKAHFLRMAARSAEGATRTSASIMIDRVAATTKGRKTA